MNEYYKKKEYFGKKWIAVITKYESQFVCTLAKNVEWVRRIPPHRVAS